MTSSARLLSTGLLRYEPPFRTVVIPESAQYLAGDDLAHVHADETDDEHAVASQVVLCELGEDARFALRRIEGSQLLANVLDLTRPIERAEEPLEEVDERYERETDEPEPDEEEDLFVEEVLKICKTMATDVKFSSDRKRQSKARCSLRCRKKFNVRDLRWLTWAR